MVKMIAMGTSMHMGAKVKGAILLLSRDVAIQGAAEDAGGFWDRRPNAKRKTSQDWRTLLFWWVGG